MSGTRLASWVIGPLEQIPLGEGRNMVVGDRTLAVFRLHGGEVYATQPNCPHRGGPLADGLTGSHTVMCPLHDRVFDLRTGAGPDCSITVLPVAVRDGLMVVSLPPAGSGAASRVA